MPNLPSLKNIESEHAFVERVRLHYQLQPTSILFGIVSSITIIAIFFSSYTSWTIIGVFAVGLAATAAIDLWLISRRRLILDASNARRFMRDDVFVMCFAGAWLGFVGVIILQNMPGEQAAYFLLFYGCYTFGAVAFNSVYLASFVAMSSFIMVPTIVAFAVSDFENWSFLATVSLTLYLYTLFFSVATNKSWRESVMLRIQNEELVKKLEEQKEIAQEASLAKSKFIAAASHDLRPQVSEFKYAK